MTTTPMSGAGSVLVIVGSTAYEGSSIIAVCSTPAQAAPLMARIRAWETAKPVPPDTDAPDAAWSSHSEAEQAWRQRFPVAGIATSHDSFTIERWDIDVLHAGVVVDERTLGG